MSLLLSLTNVPRRKSAGAHIDFLEKTPLKEQISTDRFHGMQTVIRKIQDYSTSLTQM